MSRLQNGAVTLLQTGAGLQTTTVVAMQGGQVFGLQIGAVAELQGREVPQLQSGGVATKWKNDSCACSSVLQDSEFCIHVSIL